MISPGPGGAAGVASFNTRTGAVTPANGDYTPGQVGADPAGALAAWKLIRTAASGSNALSAAAAGTFLVSNDGSIFAPGAANSGRAAFWFDPADFAVATKTVKLRVRGMLQTNAVAPTAIFTAELCPITAFGGASGAYPTIASVGAPVISAPFNAGVAPPASSQNHAEAAAVSGITAGWYALCLLLGSGMAASSTAIAFLELQVQEV